MKRPLKIKSIDPRPAGFSAQIVWQDNSHSLVRFADFIARFKIFEPLRNEPKRFESVKIEDGGLSISWSEDMTMSSDTVWRLAKEQAGEAMSWSAFKEWRERHNLTQSEVADALGLSRRTIADYERGITTIPKVVLLATKGYDTVASEKALAEPISAFSDVLTSLCRERVATTVWRQQVDYFSGVVARKHHALLNDWNVLKADVLQPTLCRQQLEDKFVGIVAKQLFDTCRVAHSSVAHEDNAVIFVSHPTHGFHLVMGPELSSDDPIAVRSKRRQTHKAE